MLEMLVVGEDLVADIDEFSVAVVELLAVTEEDEVDDTDEVLVLVVNCFVDKGELVPYTGVVAAAVAVPVFATPVVAMLANGL